MKWLLTVTLLWGLTTCRPDSDPVVAAQVQPLIGSWRLVMPDSTYGVTLRLVVDADNPPADITPFDAGGQLAVNTYSARLFAAADGKATVDRVSSTQIAGSPQATQFEQMYLDNLRTVVRFEVDAPDRVRLYYGSARGSGVLVYNRLK